MNERQRLEEQDPHIGSPWYKWGPYVAERAWGTVREDYSENGDAWSYFPFEQAHTKAYRWGEDGIAGWCDRYQVLVFAPAFWNGQDPILKERYFGLNGHEGNHGEDVKELYNYLDATPTHSYLKCVYKYPQAAFPYQLLRDKNCERSAQDPEYELLDTGVFDDNAYFEIAIEYAKASAEDTCIRISATNCSSQKAPLHLLGQLWFRNQWAWGERRGPEPIIRQEQGCLLADDTAMPSPASLPFEYRLGKRYFYSNAGGKALFTQNETGEKDAFHRYLIHQDDTAICSSGTKACLHSHFEIEPGETTVVYFRLADRPLADPWQNIQQLFQERLKEADQFYQSIHPHQATAEERMIQRQALAGMVWNKQFYYFDVEKWLKGDNAAYPPPESRYRIRNVHWQHLNSMRILTVPDKWEYPWFAAWDLAFHCLTHALIDLRFAKEQLWFLLFEQFQHPNGAIPAYEWNFSDLNPPVQAWVAFQLYTMGGKKDRSFLESCFFKLMLNFSFWVNQVDSSGCNVFEGGFLGLDNITILDRSESILDNAIVKQSDGTGWMAMFSLNLMRIALELSIENRSYETIATKFFQHFVHIGYAMKTRGTYKEYSLWDEQDGFFYDTLVYGDGHFSPLRVRSLVGLIPLFAVERIPKQDLVHTPQFRDHLLWFMQNRSQLTAECVQEDQDSYFLSLVSKEQLTKIFGYLDNPEEFLSPYGIRSLSKVHGRQPFYFKESEIRYEPGVSCMKIKGGNSNWRGPIWFPSNYLLLESLKKFGEFFQDMPLEEFIQEIAGRLISLFKEEPSGMRPIFRSFAKAKDPHFQGQLFFYEYFDAETGEGHGASHQTGWTGLVANLIQKYER